VALRRYRRGLDPAVVAGVWLPVPNGADDVTAAAFLNPGLAAWKALVWEGELAAGQTVLVLGATGTSGRIAAQLAARQGARRRGRAQPAGP
jgi:NADPH:quinone reductase-like Zn-dependent oxidoreductase